MAVYKRGGVYWFNFIYAGKRIEKPAKTTGKTVAKIAEKDYRDMLERVHAGMPAEKRHDRVKPVAEIVRDYLEHFDINHRERTVAINKSCLKHVTRLLGGRLLSDLDEQQIRKYIRARLDEGVCGRTINIELGALSRGIGKKWSQLWPRVKKLEERIIAVGRAKTSSGTGRQIPMNSELYDLLAQHAKWFTERFGAAQERFYVFPWGSTAPTRGTTTMKKAWDALRKTAAVECRIHDLRHTVATKLAEAGTPESTMLALLGHMSRAMLEHYSHVRLAAKRMAVEALTTRTSSPISDSVATNSTTVGATEIVQ